MVESRHSVIELFVRREYGGAFSMVKYRLMQKLRSIVIAKFNEKSFQKLTSRAQ